MESESRIVEAVVTVNIPEKVNLWDDDLIPVKDGTLLGVAIPVTATRTKDTCVFRLFVDYRSEKGFEICTNAKRIEVVPVYSQGDHDYGELTDLELVYSR